MSAPLSALLVDPALFTAPYDAALSAGLEAAGLRVRWAGRPLRIGEAAEIPMTLLEALYYRGVQNTAKNRGVVWKVRKVASHILGGLRLVRLARAGNFDIVHFQWAVIPLYDALLMRQLARQRPVILTVHDLAPFNGSPTSKLQTLGFEKALRAASKIIVHTESARNTLIGRGYDPRRVATIPHGPLSLGCAPEPAAPRGPSDPWRVVLFGKLQNYKGADVLVEALGRLPLEDRARLKVVIAGEPLMQTDRLLARAAELDLGDRVEFRLKRLSEPEMAKLFAEADAFIFPYRQIEASGVLHLVLPYRRWIIASDLGAFRELLAPGLTGDLVPPDDPAALASALLACIGRSPAGDANPHGVIGWDDIGHRTRALYEDALSEYAARPQP